MAISVIPLFIVITIGTLFVLYFLKNRNLWGILVGVTLLLMALIALVGEYFSIPTQVMSGFGVTAVFGGFFLLYLMSGKNPRMLLLMGIPTTLIAYLYLFAPLLPTILAYLLAIAIILGAYDYSAIDIAVQLNNTNKYLRPLLLPLFLIQKFATAVSRGIPTRTSLAVTYLLLQLAVLVAIPLSVAQSIGGLVLVEAVLVVEVCYLYVLREGVAHGKAES